MNGIPEVAATRPSPWTAQGLAKYLGVRPKAVYALIADGRLHAVRIGRDYRIADEVVQAYLTGRVKDAA